MTTPHIRSRVEDAKFHQTFETVLPLKVTVFFDGDVTEARVTLAKANADAYGEGFAFLSPGDKYDANIGADIAILRALQDAIDDAILFTISEVETEPTDTKAAEDKVENLSSEFPYLGDLDKWNTNGCSDTEGICPCNDEDEGVFEAVFPEFVGRKEADLFAEQVGEDVGKLQLDVREVGRDVATLGKAVARLIELVNENNNVISEIEDDVSKLTRNERKRVGRDRLVDDALRIRIPGLAS